MKVWAVWIYVLRRPLLVAINLGKTMTEALANAALARGEAVTSNVMRRILAGPNTSFITMAGPDPSTGEIRFGFKRADGSSLKSKYIKKIAGRWTEVERASCEKAKARDAKTRTGRANAMRGIPTRPGIL